MIDAYGIHLGALYIHFYALILLSGMLAAAGVTAYRARTRNLDPAFIWDGLLWAIVPGLIGARIYHILTPSPASGLTTQYYLQHPLQMLAIWNGGLGIYGGIIGGALGILAYARWHRQPIFIWFDLAVPGLALAQAIGRWGNFVNHELYGAPSNLSWAIEIPLDKRLPGYEQYRTFQPLFLYESLWDLASFGVLLLIEKRFRQHLREGDLVLVYLILYPIGRFFLDYVRLDSNGFGAITTAQLVSLVICLLSAAALLIRHRRTDRAAKFESGQSLDVSGEHTERPGIAVEIK